MAKKYLGETFDIHGGGVDNIFPHNECEIAQSECANEVDFARYWMLTGSLTVDGVKMSKSLGNVVNIKDALRDFQGTITRIAQGLPAGGGLEFADELTVSRAMAGRRQM